MNTNMNIPLAPLARALAVCAALVGLAGCGGGSDADTTPAPVVELGVPASAMVSAEAFSQYAGATVADESAEPISLAAMEPPVSETAEPVGLN